MKRIIRILQVLLLFAILAILGWGLVILLRKVWAGFSTISSTAQVTAVGGLITLGSLLLNRYYERRKEIDLRLRDRKLEAYSFFLDAWFEQLFSRDQDLSPKVIAAMRKFGRDLILWGNTGVIKAYASWRMNAGRGSALTSTRAFEILLLAIRKDLGHNNWQLKQDDISRVFINDVDEMKAQIK